MMSKACALYYMYSESYVNNCAILPSNVIHKFHNDDEEYSRSFMVHSLIASYGLLNLPHIRTIAPIDAIDEELKVYHTSEYIDALMRVDPELNDSQESSDSQNESDDDLHHLKEQFGFAGDADVFPGIFRYVKSCAGGSLTSAKILNQTKEKTIAIAWEGGRHHCFRSKPSGFCYVNDVVLAATQLLKTHRRVLCIDTDVHHHDGVQQAFYHTDRVLTVSFHEYGKSFYPGTGSIHETGLSNSRGENFCVNVPFAEGIVDSQYFNLFRPIVKQCIDLYQPECIIWVCGADCLAGDKLGHANLSLSLVEHLALYLKAFIMDDAKYSFLNKLCVLGGGGYDNCKTSICWATVTAALAGVKLSDDIPEHDYFELYKDTGFERRVDARPSCPNSNSPDALRESLGTILNNMEKLRPTIATFPQI